MASREAPGWDGPALVNLGDLLADLYPEKDDSRRVVVGVHLRPGMIRFNEAAVVNWFNILSYARTQDRVDDIVAFALKENPGNLALKQARERGTLAAARGPDIRRAVHWQGPSGDDLEKLVSGEQALVDVSFLEVGLKRAQAVARISCAGGGLGTGFLIEGGRLVTNHHVLPDAAAAASAEVQFNYQTDAAGIAVEPVSFRLDPGRFFRTSKVEGGDDWTVVAVAGEPEKRFAPLALAEVEIEAGERVNIIQHPMGRPKQLSFFHNTVVYVGGDRVQYLTDTLPGSSGAPVFDKQWRVVAVHHSGGWLSEPGGGNGKEGYRNEGIHVNAVIRGLRAG